MKCQKLVIACKDERKSIPYYQEVGRGYRYKNCVVVFAFPKRCYCTPQTQISFTKYYEYREERLGNNIKITKTWDKGKQVYVYPIKVWEEVKKLYIEPLASGEQPFNIGLLLVGPPGTGKSTLARLIAEIIGINYEYVSPDKILSKYVGESEKAIRRVIDNAMRSEPSIVIIDDAENLLSARKLSEMREHTSVILNIQNILFNAMQEAYNEKKKILFIATTNVKPSEIDIAFKRQGRFGDPLFIPLPDYEALSEILKEYLQEDKAKDLALKCVNMGLSTADAIAMAIRMSKGLEVRYTGEGRGYSRLYVEKVNGIEKIFNYFPEDVLHRRSRIYIHMHEDIATALVSQLSLHAKRTLIKLVDLRYYDEAVHTANMFNSVFLASTSIPPEIQQYISDNLEGSLFLAGIKPPAVPAFSFFTLKDLKNILGTRPIIEAILKYKNIKVSEQLMKKILNVASDTSRLEKILEIIALLGTINEDLLNNISYYTRG